MIKNLEELKAVTGLNREELLALLNNGERNTESIYKSNTDPVLESNKKNSSSLVDSAYYFGALVLGLGIVFFLAQIWDDIVDIIKFVILWGLSLIFFNLYKLFKKKQGSKQPLPKIMATISIISGVGFFIQYFTTFFDNYDILPGVMKILLTLGIAVVFLILLIVEKKRKSITRINASESISKITLLSILYLVFVVSGVYVLSDIILGTDMSLGEVVLMNFIVFLLLFLPNLTILKVKELSIFSFLAFNSTFVTAITYLMDKTESDNIGAVGGMILAAIWLVSTRLVRMGRMIREDILPETRGKIADLSSFIGSAMLAISAFYASNWEFFVLVSTIALIFISQIFYSRMPLVIASISGFAYISMVTSKYFADTLGWPLALIIIGISIMVSGYFLLKLKERISK